MSTNAIITVKVADTEFKHLYLSIYLHWDGYPAYAGQLLLDHYNNQEMAEALVALGDLSVLSESIDCPEGHCFDHPLEGFSVAYGRDRGEIGTEANIYRQVSDVVLDEYNYYWEGDAWYCTSAYDDIDGKVELTQGNIDKW